MFDLDCGQQTWYLKPTLYIKIVYGIFSAIYFIYLCVLCHMTSDIFYSKITKSNFNLALSILIFLIFSLGTLLIFYFKVLPNFKFLVLLLTIITIVIEIILVLVYIIKYKSEKREYNTYLDGLAYVFIHANSPEVQYFYKKVKADIVDPNDPDFYENHRKYFDNRNTGAAETLIGLFIPWIILHCLCIIVAHTSGEDGYNAIDNTPIDSSATKFG